MARRPSVPSQSDNQRFSDGPPLPRWVLWLMLPGIAAPVVIFGFILVSQRAHDEARCPYRELTRRVLAPSVIVVEEARNCLGQVEEHRYSLLRAAERRILGERRFDRQAFAPGHYRIIAELTQQGEAQLVVHNDGHDDVLFREGTPRERAKGISLGHRAATHPSEPR